MSTPEATGAGYPFPIGLSVRQCFALSTARSHEGVYGYRFGSLCKDMGLAPAKGQFTGKRELDMLHGAGYLVDPRTEKSSIGGPDIQKYTLGSEGYGALDRVVAASGYILGQIPAGLDRAPAKDFNNLGNMKLGVLAILISGMEKEGTYASKIFTRFFEGSGTEITGKPSSRVMRNLNTAKLFSDPTIVEVDNAPDRNIYRTTRLGGRVLALAVPPLEMLAGEKKQQLSVLNQ